MGKRRRDREVDQISLSYFDSAFGVIGIGYTERSVVALQLPEDSPEQTRRRLASSLPDALEVELAGVGLDAATRIQALLAGEDADLDPIPIDISQCSEFNQQVYAVVRMIERGEALTYGEVARRVGEPGGAQAVGRAMGANPIPVIVPCHRVVGANRELVGFSANGGIETKRRMLLVEECPVVPPTLFDNL